MVYTNHFINIQNNPINWDLCLMFSLLILWCGLLMLTNGNTFTPKTIKEEAATVCTLMFGVCLVFALFGLVTIIIGIYEHTQPISLDFNVRQFALCMHLLGLIKYFHCLMCERKFRKEIIAIQLKQSVNDIIGMFDDSVEYSGGLKVLIKQEGTSIPLYSQPEVKEQGIDDDSSFTYFHLPSKRRIISKIQSAGLSERVSNLDVKENPRAWIAFSSDMGIDENASQSISADEEK